MLLIEAVQQGRMKQLKLLIKVGIDLNQTDKLGQTALMHSCFVEDNKLRQMAIKTLVTSGSDINKRDIFGRTVLSWACLHGRIDTVDFLLNSSVCFDIEVDVSDKDGNSTLLHAVMSDRIAVVQLVLSVLKETGNIFNMHRANNAGMSPLVLAFLRGDRECSKLLIKEGSAPVSSVLQYLKRSGIQESSPFCSRQVAWKQKCALRQSAPRRQPQTVFNLKKITEDDVLQFLFGESESTPSADKSRVHKQSVGEKTSPESSNKKFSGTREPGPIARVLSCASNHGSSCSGSEDVDAKPAERKLSRKQTNTSSFRQEPPILKLFSLYSDVHSSSFRQGYPAIRYKPAPEIVEEPTTNSLLIDGIRSCRSSFSAISGEDVFDESMESAMDRHLRLKYARSSRAASLQVARLPPIGLSGLRPGRMKRTRSSTTIKRF